MFYFYCGSVIIGLWHILKLIMFFWWNWITQIKVQSNGKNIIGGYGSGKPPQCLVDNSLGRHLYVTLKDTSSCSHCNGFCGPNFNQPMCDPCHKFLFSARKRKRLSDAMDNISNVNKQLRYDASNRQMVRPMAKPLTYQPQLKDLSKIFHEFITDNNNETNANTEPQSSISNIPVASDHSYSSDTEISVLPVEILLKIFSSLDDIMLLEVSKVSQQWQQIVESKQELWKTYTKKRWPLFRRKTGNTNWYKIYSMLQSSCFCRTCAIQMMVRSQNNKEHLRMRKRAERDRLTLFRPNGIRAIPLSGRLAHWQGYIAGPADSPYEGGIFYLYIQLPLNYPFDPPIVKFLTKIIHPNISRHGDIGLDILTSNYCSSLTISPILLSIQSILCDPYTKVCMEPELGRLYDHDRPRFDALARHWTKKYAMTEVFRFDD